MLETKQTRPTHDHGRGRWRRTVEGRKEECESCIKGEQNLTALREWYNDRLAQEPNVTLPITAAMMRNLGLGIVCSVLTAVLIAAPWLVDQSELVWRAGQSWQ